MRRGTITAAAGELGTSQPAVSQQIHALEEALGVKLFRRAGRTLEPTGEATTFAEAITASLNAVADAAQALRPRAGRPRRFVLSAPFGFAYLWLEPLLPKLEEAFPDLGLVVRAEDDFKSAAQKKPDLEIRFGPASSAASGVHFLMHEIVQPICSPEFARRHELTRETATPRKAQPFAASSSGRGRSALVQLAGVVCGKRRARLSSVAALIPQQLSAAAAGGGIRQGTGARLARSDGPAACVGRTAGNRAGLCPARMGLFPAYRKPDKCRTSPRRRLDRGAGAAGCAGAARTLRLSNDELAAHVLVQLRDLFFVRRLFPIEHRQHGAQMIVVRSHAIFEV